MNPIAPALDALCAEVAELTSPLGRRVEPGVGVKAAQAVFGQPVGAAR